MAFLSTITGSLPNVLNLLQGKWDVQYKVGKYADTGAIPSFTSWATDLISWVNSRPNPNDGAKWESLDFDSVIDVQEVAETVITKNPIEGGSFRSANKVRKPKVIKVTLAKAGIGYGIEDSLAEVKMLLPLARYNKNKKKEGYGLSGVIDNIASAIGGFLTDWGINRAKNEEDIPLEFRILTPFDMITGLNLIKLDYTFKKDNGRNMLLMFLTFEEVINIESETTVKNPTDSSKENIGRLSLQQ